MGQTQFGCKNDCRQFRYQILDNSSSKNVQMIRNKTYKKLNCDIQNIKYKNINTQDLRIIQFLPEDYQQYVISLKTNNHNYIDSQFPHKNTSISSSLNIDSIIWKRIKQVCRNPVLKSNFYLNYSQLNQYSKNQAKLYSVLTVISQFTQVISNLISWPLLQQGIYGVTFYINGIKQLVIIDDYIPTLSDKYLFTWGKQQNECWMILVEKALAKLAGSYEDIYNLGFQEIFEQITGIPAQQQLISSEKGFIKEVLVIKQSNSEYKIQGPIKTQQIEQGAQYTQQSNSQNNDEYINFLRKPNYQISSVQLNYNKEQQSFYFRFNLQKQEYLSLRISQFSKKLITHSKYQYSEIIFQVAKIEDNQDLTKVANGIQKDRKTYLQAEYITLSKGQYFMHILIKSKSQYRNIISRCSLIAYSIMPINFKQILNISKAQTMKNKMLMNEYYKLIQQVSLSAKGNCLETNFVWSRNRALLMIKNHQNGKKKIKMKLLNELLRFEDYENHRQRIMILDGRSQKLISLFKKHKDRKISKQSCYQIRVIN